MSENLAVSINLIGNYHFAVELDGVIEGGFSEVSGLESETEYDEYHEGGLNTYVHRFPKLTKSPPLVLKRGICESNKLWDWYYHASIGKVYRCTGAIILLNPAGYEVRRWNFKGAYPVKWVGPQFDATANEIAVELVEIVHQQLIADNTFAKKKLKKR